jgi:hypothetical protein
MQASSLRPADGTTGARIAEFAPERAAPGSPRVSASSSFSIFSFLFALAMLFHEGKWNYAVQNPLDVGIIAMSLWVLTRPSAKWRSVALHTCVLWTAIDRLPWISNHFLFAALISLSVLLAMAIEAIRGVDGAAEPLTDRAYGTFAPAIRIELVLLYAFSAFHKLNADFFDPQLSCGAQMYLRAAARAHGWLPQGLIAQNLAIYATILTEALIALLLSVRVTRKAGILLAVGFHFVLGVIGFGNFSSICLAALFTFVTTQPRNVSQSRPVVRSSRAMALVVAMLIPAGFLVALATFERWATLRLPVAFNPESDALRPNPLRDAFWIFWIAVGAAALVVSVRVAVVERIGRPGWLLGIVPAILLLNGLCPYLGLKTETSFSMFSNLRTEGGQSNHLLVRRTAPLADYQHDVVRIEATTDALLQRFVQPDVALTWFELQSYASRKALAGEGNFAITYARGGHVYSLARVTDDADLCRPQPWLARKLFLFRPVKFGRANTCGH